MNKTNNKKYKSTKKNFTINEIINSYIPLIKLIARKISHRLPPSIDIDDLISSGYLGLLDAFKKFDQTRNVKFKTYAKFRIQGAMLDEIRNLDLVSRSVRNNIKKIENTISHLKLDLGREPTSKEIAINLNLTKQKYFKLVDQSQSVTHVSFHELENLTKPLNEDINKLLNQTYSQCPIYNLNSQTLKKELFSAITKLPEKQKMILILYYFKEMNFKNIGLRLNLSESRISQLHSNAVSHLRTILPSKILDLLEAA